ncbi:MAG: beta-N-acetylhexosaminidase [Chitinispirillaceae bacterium]|nr:beta-N-acetylhexosaminidase [Chitinispirillaceae bacterium]
MRISSFGLCQWYISVTVITLSILAGNADAAINIIPLPRSMAARSDTFIVPDTVAVYSDDATSDSTVPWIARLFQQAGKKTRHVFPAQYANITVRHASGTDTLGSDGYRLTVTRDNIAIEAQTTTGQFYAVQSLRQMMPPEIERKSSLAPSTIRLQGVAIVDNKSRLGYRGTMLDVSRHFITLNYVRETIERMALFKLNVLHLHLTDDQGWRIEIKSYPNLTTIGAATQVGGAHPPAGDRWYYTQDEMKDLVAYAAARKIAIMPEIDMPGHCQAAIASYNNLGTSGTWNHTEVYTGFYVGESCMDINNGVAPVVDTFVRKVWTELVPIFPYEYFHIGADECKYATQAAFTAFVKRVEQIIHGLGKKITGWDEIYGIVSDPRVQTWMQGDDQPGTIFSWCNKMYWDQSNRSGDTGTYPWCVQQVTLQDVYGASPQISSPNSHAGVEGCLWGDKVVASSDDRQLFPRTAAEAEIGWTAANNWTEFRSRVAPFSVRFNLMGISWYTNENLVTWQTGYTQYRDSSDTSVFSNFMPTLIPVDTIRQAFIVATGSRRPPALAAGSRYRIFDLRGRLIGTSDGHGLKNAVKSLVPPDGVYFIVEEKNGSARKILK